MSTILLSSKDPALAAKLLKVAHALRSGADFERAAREAGLGRETARELLDSITAYLEKHVRDAAGDGREAGKKPDSPGPARVAGHEGELHLVAISDGASRGNPGEAACAVIITDASGEELLRRAKRLGVATNNVAEYQGVLLALELGRSLGASHFLLKLDSELVVKQLKSEYKVKNASLKPLFERAGKLIREFDRFDIVHVPREQTKAVDKLANNELDGKN